MLYLKMPAGDSTNYVFFYTLAANLALWLSITVGTWFVDLVGDFRLVFGTVSFDGVQLLFGIVTLISIGTAVLARFLAHQLEPKGGE